MNRLGIFIISTIISSILAVAGFNYYRYTRSLDKISAVEQRSCAFLTKSQNGSKNRFKSLLTVKVLPAGPVFEADVNLLLGIKTDIEDLRKGVACEIARDPKKLFLKIKSIQGQEVSHKWQNIEE